MENFCTCIYDACRAESFTQRLIRKAVEALVGAYSSLSLVAFSLIHTLHPLTTKALL